MPSRIERHVLSQVWASPLRLGRRSLHQRREPELGRGIVAGVEPVLVERLLERVDLRLGDADLGLPDLIEIAWRDEPGQEADDQHHHEQFEQRKAGHRPTNPSLFGTHGIPLRSRYVTSTFGAKTRRHLFMGWDVAPLQPIRHVAADAWSLLTKREAL